MSNPDAQRQLTCVKYVITKMLSIGRYALIMHTDITTPGRWSRCFWKPSGRYPGGFAFPGYPIIFAIRQSMMVWLSSLHTSPPCVNEVSFKESKTGYLVSSSL